MGLDMYLNKIKKVKEVPFNVLGNIYDVDDLKEKDVDLYNKIKNNIIQRGSFINWNSIQEEVGYWRKANHIHEWFVENVQDNKDDCRTYEVSKENVRDLLDTLNSVIESLEKSKVEILKTTNFNGEEEEFKTYLDTDVANDLLPTQQGFFFGGNEYDEYYLDDCNYTKELCEKILKEFDFENNHLCYSASW